MNRPIGLLDSGVGGISVLQALQKLLPHENFIYFADSVHFPYGEKSPLEVTRYTSQITAFLLSQNIQMLVVACHTASAMSLNSLQANFPIPVIGMIQPTLATLKKVTKNRRIGILGTKGTIQSDVYQKAIRETFEDAVIFPIVCLELEKKIENNEVISQELIKECLKPILGQEIDSLLLVCTHYPHIQLEIEQELDPQTTVINPSLSVAEEVKKQLKETPSSSHEPHHILYTSGNLKDLKKFLNKHPLKASFEVKEITL